MIPESTFLSKLAPNPCSHLPHVSYLPAGTGSDEHNHNNGNNTVLRASMCQVPLGASSLTLTLTPQGLVTPPPFSRGINCDWRRQVTCPSPHLFPTPCCLLEMLRGQGKLKDGRDHAMCTQCLSPMPQTRQGTCSGHHLYSLEALGLEGAPDTFTFCVGIHQQPDRGCHVTPSRPLCIEESSQPRTLYADPLRPLSTAKHVPQALSFSQASHPSA